MTFAHTPVLPVEVLDYLAVRPGGCYIDGTVGGGGHAELILRAAEGVRLLGIDRDDEALAAAGQRLAPFGEQVRLVKGRFSDLASLASQAGWNRLDGILLDVGVSSHQLDSAGRGFSFRQDGPLDMRMDRGGRLTAAALLNTATEFELRRIFRDYGEEPQAGRLARAVVEQRAVQPFARTSELAAVAERVVMRRRGETLPAATRCFQALRIAVNQELDELAGALEVAVDWLRPGGRLVVISFHSLEDRIVKNCFRLAAATCVCPPDFPVCRCGKQATLKILTRRPVQAGDEELARNRRAAPAKLRAAERL